MPSIPANLFPVCRAVYNEITSMLYGENRFALTRRAPRGLKLLERVTASSLQKVGFLIVRLNMSNCDGQCCGVKDQNCGSVYGSCTQPEKHDALLDYKIASHKLIILQWEKMCQRLATLVQPGTLKLYLICDCANLETAQMIAQPLTQLPLLTDCAVRLAYHRDKEILALAKATVQKLTAYQEPPPMASFKFPDLPREIQLRILEFSRLSTYLYVRGNRLDYNTSCPLRGMLASSPSSEVESGASYLTQCFCERGHSAYNLHCGCSKRGFPSSYFLVSREFRELAMKVMYGKSLITIYGHQAPDKSKFPHAFSCFPSDSIRFITRLILHQHLDIDDLLEDLKAREQVSGYWNRTIEVLAKIVNPAQLDLEIRFNEKFYICVWSCSTIRRDKGPDSTNPNYEERMLNTYTALIKPVAMLRGLKRFAVHLNWNTSCGNPEGQVWEKFDYGGISRGVIWGRGSAEKLKGDNGVWSIAYPDGRELEERRMEEMVMGKGYDAWEHGKVVSYDLRDAYY